MKLPLLGLILLAVPFLATPHAFSQSAPKANAGTSGASSPPSAKVPPEPPIGLGGRFEETNAYLHSLVGGAPAPIDENSAWLPELDNASRKIRAFRYGTTGQLFPALVIWEVDVAVSPALLAHDRSLRVRRVGGFLFGQGAPVEFAAYVASTAAADAVVPPSRDLVGAVIVGYVGATSIQRMKAWHAHVTPAAAYAQSSDACDAQYDDCVNAADELYDDRVIRCSVLSVICLGLSGPGAVICGAACFSAGAKAHSIDRQNCWTEKQLCEGS